MVKEKPLDFINTKLNYPDCDYAYKSDHYFLKSLKTLLETDTMERILNIAWELH